MKEAEVLTCLGFLLLNFLLDESYYEWYFSTEKDRQSGFCFKKWALLIL